MKYIKKYRKIFNIKIDTINWNININRIFKVQILTQNFWIGGFVIFIQHYVLLLSILKFQIRININIYIPLNVFELMWMSQFLLSLAVINWTTNAKPQQYVTSSPRDIARYRMILRRVFYAISFPHSCFIYIYYCSKVSAHSLFMENKIRTKLACMSINLLFYILSLKLENGQCK